jgi:hypothetical protein
MTLADAVELATRAHEGVADLAGRPYIDHPLRVMARAARRPDLIGDPRALLAVDLPERETQLAMVAVLHDVLEDTPHTAADLTALGCPPQVVNGVVAVSRRVGEPYPAFVARAAADPLGRFVKRADLQDNADPARLALLPADVAERLTAKYADAARDLDEWIAYWAAVDDVAAHPEGHYVYYRNDSPRIGLMRQWRWPEADGRRGGRGSWPEFIHPQSTGGRWRPGTAYELDAITGIGADPHSVGESADELTEPEAERFAAELGVRLGAPRCREWPLPGGT